MPATSRLAKSARADIALVVTLAGRLGRWSPHKPLIWLSWLRTQPASLMMLPMDRDMDKQPNAAVAADNNMGDVRRAVMSAREAAAQAGVHERTVRRAIESGALQAEQIDGVYHITPAALDMWMSLRQASRGQKRPPRGTAAPKAPAPPAADMVPAAVFREERDRSEALARELRDTAALVGMLRGRLEAVESERDRLLAITAHTQDAPVERSEAPGRAEVHKTTADTLRPEPELLWAGKQREPAWRRWWRRVIGQ